MPVAPRITLLTRVALPPEAVFQLWTDPGHVQYWWGGSRGRLMNLQLDARPRGAFWMGVQLDGGTGYDNYGRFVELIPGEVIVADWEHGGPVSRLVIQLLKRGNQTEITLTHRNFPSEQARDFQLERWEDALAAFRDYSWRADLAT
jgi:uncharacterized protein YndB with AHSA1/START domain